MRSVFFAVAGCMLTSGCGQIVLGANRVAPDGGVVTPADTGVIPSADASTSDAAGGGDAAGCTPLMRPAPPAAWPYPRTKASYQLHFWDALPGKINCSTPACHGTAPGAAVRQIPFIAATDAELDLPANLNAAIDELWSDALPSIMQGPPAPLVPTPPLVWNHDPAGENKPLPFDATQMAYAHNFVDRSYDCAYLTAPDAGPNACPLTLDLTYCNR